MLKFIDIAKVGDSVTYRDFGGGLRTVKITAVTDNVKNGRAGFDGIVFGGPEDGASVWGYAKQIEALTSMSGEIFRSTSSRRIFS